jgi:protein-L-isoaspartate O-methyltransferase
VDRRSSSDSPTRAGPVIYDQDPDTGEWLTHDASDPAWQERIYAKRGLFTKIGEGTGSWGTAVVGLSSTSTPGLMTRLLETLDIHEGHDVLEIGTGTGYNAALLAHRLGAEHVFSVDIDRELVDLVRDRLARIGYRPTLVVADGADGLPEHAPYDRIIATCSVPAIPWAWLEQTRVGGLILADLKLSVHAGNLVLLTRLAGRAEGRFDAPGPDSWRCARMSQQPRRRPSLASGWPAIALRRQCAPLTSTCFTLGTTSSRGFSPTSPRPTKSATGTPLKRHTTCGTNSASPGGTVSGSPPPQNSSGFGSIPRMVITPGHSSLFRPQTVLARLVSTRFVRAPGQSDHVSTVAHEISDFLIDVWNPIRTAVHNEVHLFERSPDG